MTNMIALLIIVICAFSSFATQLQDLSYEEIEKLSYELKSGFASVNSANDLFKLSKSVQGGFSCSPAIIRVSYFANFAEDSSRPSIVISGEIHGDERVGPPSTLLSAQLMVWSAQCEIEHKIEACSKLNKDYQGLTKGQRVWLAFLASRRDSIIIPTANCLGHKFRQREEANNIDPNRDFAYSRKNRRCFMTNIAKFFKYIMEENIIQMVVTYHGGMVALGYEWGSINHRKPRDGTPDDIANKQIAQLLSQYAGKHENGGNYPIGRINSIIYPVDGGMEDWLYAAGWDKDEKILRKDCLGFDTSANSTASSTTSGSGTTALQQQQQQQRLRKGRHHTSNRAVGHRKLLTIPSASKPANLTAVSKPAAAVAPTTAGVGVDTSGNRALVFLVETSDAKSPALSSLGNTNRVLDPLSTTNNNGHIPRNTRLALMAIDLLQPYICFNHYELLSTSTTSNSNNKLQVSWYIGGSTTVDQTFLLLHKIPSTSSTSSSSSYSSTRNWKAYLGSFLTLGSNDDQIAQLLQASSSSLSSATDSSNMKLISPIFHLGHSRWYGNHNSTSSSSSSSSSGSSGSSGSSYDAHDPLRPKTVYSHAIDISQFPPSPSPSTSANRYQRYWIVAWAMVDQSFATLEQGFPTGTSGPLSHYANLRTRSNSNTTSQAASWHCPPTGPFQRTCQSHRYWPSDYLEVEIDHHQSKSIKMIKAVKHCAWWEYDSTAAVTVPAATGAGGSSSNAAVVGNKPRKMLVGNDVTSSMTAEQETTPGPPLPLHHHRDRPNHPLHPHRNHLKHQQQEHQLHHSQQLLDKSTTVFAADVANPLIVAGEDAAIEEGRVMKENTNNNNYNEFNKEHHSKEAKKKLLMKKAQQLAVLGVTSNRDRSKAAARERLKHAQQEHQQQQQQLQHRQQPPTVSTGTTGGTTTSASAATTDTTATLLSYTAAAAANLTSFLSSSATAAITATTTTTTAATSNGNNNNNGNGAGGAGGGVGGADTTSPSQATTSNNQLIKEQVAESYRFERSYLILFIVFLIVAMIISSILSQWRRNRIYNTLINNRYMNLPTGFVAAAPSSSNSLVNSGGGGGTSDEEGIIRASRTVDGGGGGGFLNDSYYEDEP